MKDHRNQLGVPSGQTYKPGHMHHHHFPFPSTAGEKHPAAKVTDAQVDEIRQRKAAGEDPDVLAAEFGICRQYVFTLCRRVRRVPLMTVNINSNSMEV